MAGKMNEMQVAVGMLHITISIVLPPVYIRFVYIFITRKKYRDLECYRIMTLTGILQLFAGPGAFCCGLIQLIGHDPCNILLFFVILFSASIAAEVCLNLVLALNRLKVIFEIRTPPYFNKILMVLDCLYGVGYAACLFSPFCGYLMPPGQYVNSLILTVSSALTFLCYILIIFNLIWIRTKSPTVLRKEGAIFVYAGVRFAIDMSLSIVFFFVYLPPSPWTELAVGLAYILNQLLVSPLLYLTLTKSLRDEFMEIFRFRRLTSVTSLVSTSQPTKTS